ncbi:SDR family NAD(P)-dependent oxidoreductase [Novosphingobium sp. G106]|uniref:SDR family NAD(P)-dependent oxidoreductase n=1 Tax=Novosphingobium sp. G106 TaxID=2849500 RepID=UPI001C2CC7B4|nr:SDR family NAD(P)-dependent oxidoreductase [Novosphingobium sp. G106]MBV1691616.1 SDR family NAD(P)-dependent oxidoreductase [Novosphingobium sp. G106]
MAGEIRLDGRVALVTGAGRGLGRSHALELAARGAKVVVNDLGCGLFGEGADDSVAMNVVREIEAAGGQAVANTLTIDEPANARAMVAQAVDTFGRLDIVVNNAGFLRRRPFLDHSEDMVRDLISVHLLGSYFVSQAAFEVMQAQQYGRMVFTSSPGGTRGNPWVTAYGAAKAGIIGLAQTIALAGEPVGIKANVISPYGNTRMGDAMETKSRDEDMGQHKELMAGVLDCRHASAAAVYLASEECELNHKVLTVGGGRVALSAILIGEGFQAPFGDLLTPELVRDNLPAILDLAKATNPTSSDQEGSAFLGPAVKAAMAAQGA